jgi:hypothetical protein
VTAGGPGDTTAVLFNGASAIGWMFQSSMTSPFAYGGVRPEYTASFAAGVYNFSVRMFVGSGMTALAKAGNGGSGFFVPATIQVDQAL